MDGTTGKRDDASNEFDEVSSFSSIDSYQPQAFTGPDGTSRQEKNSDASSRGSGKSGTTLDHRDSNEIDRAVTHNAINGTSETAESLKEAGLHPEKKAIPDINGPISEEHNNSQFPEEYRLETQTGLVKLKTLNELSRDDTRVSIGKNGKLSKKSSRTATIGSNGNQESSTEKAQAEASQNAENLEHVIEKNKHRIEKFEKHKHEKGLRGFVHRLFD